MSNTRVTDPEAPAVTFGRYVIPETVQQVVEPEPVVPDPVVFQPSVPKPPFNPAVLTKVLFVILTFLMGALTMLLLAGPSAPVAALGEPSVIDVDQADMQAPAQAQVNKTALLQEAVLASVNQGVTRGNANDLISPSTTAAQGATDALSMQEILLGLTPKHTAPQAPALQAGPVPTQQVVTRDKLQTLRDSVLAGSYTVDTTDRNGQQRLSLRLLAAPMSQDEAAVLIEQAAAKGEIDLPGSLATSDGSYDADTLLFNLVQTSLANDGTAEGAAAAQEMSRRAFAASQAKTKRVSGQRIYVVEPGDSLAYISLQFYGRPSDYIKIFEANQPDITSPDRIQIGQRLIIPS